MSFSCRWEFLRTIADYAQAKSDQKIVNLLEQYAKNPPMDRRPSEKMTNKLPALIKKGEFKMPELEPKKQ